MTHANAIAVLSAVVARYMHAWNTNDHERIIDSLREGMTGGCGPAMPGWVFQPGAAFVSDFHYPVPGDPGTVRVDYADLTAHFTATHEQLSLF